jgi:hypothetical protein
MPHRVGSGIQVGFGESAHDFRDGRYMPPARSQHRDTTSENTADYRYKPFFQLVFSIP